MDIHVANSEEFDELLEICTSVFSDSKEFIKNFYKTLNCTPYVLVDNDQVQSCLTLFETGKYMGKTVMTSYAICTKPDSRNKGYAGQLVKYVRDKVIESGKLSLISPASKSLVSFYEKLGYSPYFYADENTIDANPDLPQVKMEKISVEEYNKRRNELLQGINHIEINNDVLKQISAQKDNEFDLFLVDGKNICILKKNEAYLLELIVNDENYESVASSIANTINVNNIKYRSPAKNNSYVQSMLAGVELKSNEKAYYGLPMD